MRTRAAPPGQIHGERSIVTESEATPQTTSQLPSLARRRWPTLVGLGFAALVAFDLVSGVELAPVLAASAAVYLGAAALGRPRAAWPLFFATVVVITAARLADDRLEPTWVVLGGAVALGIYGLLRGAARPGYGLPLQTLALLGFGAAAGAALVVNPELGAYLVAQGLANGQRPVVVEQGHTMGRPSRIEVRVSGAGVRVCGTAVVVLEGRFKQ